MTANDPAQTFKCPSCGAPVEIEEGRKATKCSYCGETVIIPAELRSETHSTPKPAPKQAAAPKSRPYVQRGGYVTTLPKASRRPSLLSRIIFVLIVVGVIGSFAFGFNPFGMFLFANTVLTFGSEGIGQGMFDNPRAIGVDGKGNIVVANSDDGRVQTFDPKGNFISSFTVKQEGKPSFITSIAVSPEGKIYVSSGSNILIFDESGKELGSILSDINHSYDNVVLGADGRLYAISFSSEMIVRFNIGHSIDLEIPNSVSSITGDNGDFPSLAVDGLGNIYVASRSAVIKYSPEGQFVDQFGGRSEDITTFEPGKFASPMGIAIDGYGRIFINDEFNLQVFDADGNYLRRISGGYYGIAFDQQNNLYTTPVTENRVMKFQIKKPAQP
jgi:DNA-binding beta-propeller fold protein YncE/DNA-directed RNA polymerase subunit RPC12/RpoP